MKRWILWVAVAIAVVLVGGGVWRALAARQAQQKALAESSAQRKEATLDLAPGEMVTVQRQRIALGVPVSGSLRAVESAMVKARAAGELQGLTLREGDSVRAGQEIARGLANYASSEARLICRKPSSEFERCLGYVAEPEMIHRTNLVLTKLM